MQPLIEIAVTAGLALFFTMVLLWIISLMLKDASIVDIFWGSGFVLSAWIYFALTPDGFTGRKILISLLTTVWGLRLSIHVFLRNRGKGEDYRYQVWRREAGNAWWWQSLFRVFLLQGLLMWLISIPLLAAQWNAQPAHLTWIDVAAMVAWAVGFFFEAAGDYQLTRFKRDPANKGKVLNKGVWQYTRHPNYFGDAAQWWGYFLFAAATGAYLTVYSPILMTYFLVNVSGVALLEKSMENRPGYRSYIESTSAFVPWFPKKKPRN